MFFIQESCRLPRPIFCCSFPLIVSLGRIRPKCAVFLFFANVKTSSSLPFQLYAPPTPISPRYFCTRRNDHISNTSILLMELRFNVHRQNFTMRSRIFIFRDIFAKKLFNRLECCCDIELYSESNFNFSIYIISDTSQITIHNLFWTLSIQIYVCGDIFRFSNPSWYVSRFTHVGVQSELLAFSHTIFNICCRDCSLSAILTVFIMSNNI